MPKYSYPLVKYHFPDSSSEASAFHTLVPLKISNPETGQSVRITGLVDTGADACLFPADVAEATGHDLKGDGVKSNVNIGIEQTNVTVYKHTFILELLSPNYQNTVWSSGEIEVDCTEANPPVLLGAIDFLKFFNLTIDYINERLYLEW
ncbi:MAG: hypothetical protein P9M10_03200 [Candidatus Euphemobacter frigidus]|nr:hypothetical protein [Candidatus Euphemobacter frigidus]